MKPIQGKPLCFLQVKSLDRNDSERGITVNKRAEPRISPDRDVPTLPSTKCLCLSSHHEFIQSCPSWTWDLPALCLWLVENY